MTKKQETQLPELLQNFIFSSQMEGLAVSEETQAMCLAVLNGETSLKECLERIRANYTAG